MHYMANRRGILPVQSYLQLYGLVKVKTGIVGVNKMEVLIRALRAKFLKHV